MKKNKSKFLSVNGYDMLKGAIAAFVSALITGLYLHFTDTPSVPTSAELHKIGWTAVATLLGYVKVKFFSNSDGQIYTSEKKADTTSPLSPS